jgi:hypothetical protein
MEYIVIPVEGPVANHQSEQIDLDTLYKGTKAETVQAISLFREDHEAVCWMDEDYLTRPDQTVNVRADWLVRRFSPGTLIGGSGIVGDCVLTGGADADGETLGLSPEWIAFLTDAATFEQVHEPA